MKHEIKRWLVLLLGWMFLILGIAGFFLPILQGFLFSFIGLGILSSRSRWARKMLAGWKEKHPREYEIIQAKKEKLLRIIGRRRASHP